MIKRLLLFACLTWLSGTICGCSTISSIFNKRQNSAPAAYVAPPKAYVSLTFDSGEIEFKTSGKGVSIKETVNFNIATNVRINNITIEETKRLMDKNDAVVQTVTRSFVPISNNVNAIYNFTINNKQALCDDNYLLTDYVVFDETKLSIRSNLRQSYCPKRD